ncbi:MAG: hypothetical protein P9L94_20215 [Candidatus Hinthialibacter antarcticus]|nr:hypothetical protein [Candidatus Hinthialibacter antarcticus]
MKELIVFNPYLEQVFILGVYLALVKLLFLIIRFVFQSVLKISRHSIPANLFLFFARLIGCSFFFAVTFHLLKRYELFGNAALLWFISLLFILLYSISDVMPMREAWSYTRNGPLMSRAYIDVFHPLVSMLLLPAGVWLISMMPSISLEMIAVQPSRIMNLIAGLITSLTKMKGDQLVQIEQNITIAFYSIFSFFLIFHLMRSVNSIRDYCANFFEVIRGQEPDPELASALANPEVSDATQQENEETVSNDDKPKE